MAAEVRADVHHRAPRSLLGLFDAAAGGFADWSEFDAEAARWGIKVRRLLREELTALIAGSTSEHRRLHQEEGDFVRWGRRGGRRPLALYGRRGQHVDAEAKRSFRITCDAISWLLPFLLAGYRFPRRRS